MFVDQQCFLFLLDFSSMKNFPTAVILYFVALRLSFLKILFLKVLKAGSATLIVIESDTLDFSSSKKGIGNV